MIHSPSKFAMMLVYVLALIIASLLVPLFMQGLGSPTLVERLAVTFMMPFWCWVGTTMQRPIIGGLIVMPVVLCGLGAIKTRTWWAFALYLLVIAIIWLTLVWFAWDAKYA